MNITGIERRDTVKTLAVLLLSAALSFGQTPTTKAQQQDCANATKAFNAQPAFKLSLEKYMALSEAMRQACGTKVVPQEFYPVSKYVRKVGVLYLTTIDEFSKHCDGQMSDPAVESDCSAAMVNWQSTFEPIESMVDIELSDSKSIGDLRTWDLLKYAKMSKRMYLAGFILNGEPGKAMMETWTNAMSTCRTYAEFAVFGSGSRTADADIGAYSGDGGCAELIQKALTPKPSSQPVSAELRAKCVPFADGSVDKVLTKAMPLPPRECKDALGWMRDARLDALYSAENGTSK